MMVHEKKKSACKVEHTVPGTFEIYLKPKKKKLDTRKKKYGLLVES